MVPSPEEILKAIVGLSIQDALKYLAANKITDFTAKSLESVKNVIKAKYNEGKYAFVPNREEAERLKEFESNSMYKQVKLLVPHLRYIDLIRTGLLIDSYHRQNREGDNERVISIKQNISRRPNGGKLLKIVKLPCAPFFAVILRYLYDLKVKGYSDQQLEEKFDELVAYWEESSEFVKNEHDIPHIVKFCEAQAHLKKSPIFLLAMRNAVKKLEKAMQKLEDAGFFKKNNYSKTIITSEEGNQPRVEVTLIHNES